MSILIDQRVFTLDIDDEKRLSAIVESLFCSTPCDSAGIEMRLLRRSSTIAQHRRGVTRAMFRQCRDDAILCFYTVICFGVQPCNATDLSSGMTSKTTSARTVALYLAAPASHVHAYVCSCACARLPALIEVTVQVMAIGHAPAMAALRQLRLRNGATTGAWQMDISDWRHHLSFRTPLKLEEVRQIAQRRQDDDEVVALVWEITRLQSLVAQSAQLLSMQPQSGAEATNLRRELLDRLSVEPVVNWKL